MATHSSDRDSPQSVSYHDICMDAEPVHAMRYHSEPDKSRAWISRDHWLAQLIEVGDGQMYLADQEPQVVQAGQCWIIPARCPYRLQPTAAAGQTSSSLIFTTDIISTLAKALGPERPDSWPWRTSEPARLWNLDADGCIAFIDIVNAISMQVNSRHSALGTICSLLQLLEPKHISPYADLPPWLRLAVIQMRCTKYLQQGPSCLAMLTGKHIDHINRVIRQHRQCTATELVNQLRIEFACSILRLSKESISHASASAGFADVSHFYKVFKKLTGMTPKAYRDQMTST